MAIQYSMEAEGDLLVVVASGADEDLNDVKAYGVAVIQAAIQTGCRLVLCNELDLEYKLGTVDTFESASYIASYAPHVAKVAIVCNAQCINDALFWETVAVNRGLMVRVFRSVADANVWLKE